MGAAAVAVSVALAGQRGTGVMRTGRWMSRSSRCIAARGERWERNESVGKAEGEPRASHDMSPGLCDVSFSEDNHGTGT